MKAGRIFKGLPFVYENEDLIPRGYRIGRHSNRPIARKVSEFRGGDLHRVYPSLSAAAREMGVAYKLLWKILHGQRKNHTGKDFDFASPLDECLVEIQERNKQPYK